MKYIDIHPYHITKNLWKKGWEYNEDGIYVPLSFSKDKNQLYLKLKKDNGDFYYSRAVKEENGRFKVENTIIRDTTIEKDLNGEGLRVEYGPYDERTTLHDPLLKNVRHMMGSSAEITDEDVATFLNNIIKDMEEEKCLDIFLKSWYAPNQFNDFKKEEKEMIELFSKRKNVGRSRQKLANWLKTRFDVVLRKNTHNIYILDEKNNSYSEVTADELHVKVSEILGPQLINDDDLKWALSYISDRLDPQHNIVKFSNCIFDMDQLEVIENTEPVFTLVETPYRYNPNAKSEVLKNFLQSSLAKTTTDETEATILGVKQLVGYLFTSGNKLNLLPMITGISGGGKSVFANILTEIFGKDKIADLKLQEIEKNTHATSSFVNKHLNIIQDSDNSTINNNSLIKQITGNDPLQVNPKHQDPYVLPKEEVPKTILVCNSLPYFRRLEQALLERFMIVEFNVKFRGTDDENPNLLNEILDNPEEIEWLIYQSIQAYKEMLEKGEDFMLRKDGEATRTIVDKHQNPINYLLNKVIIAHNSDKTEAAKDENVKSVENYVYTQDLNLVIRNLAKQEGIELTLNRKGEIAPRQLINTIRYEFDLHNSLYDTSTHAGSRYYPDLITNNLYWQVLNQIPEGYNVPADIKKELKLETPEKNKEDSEEGEKALQNT